MKKYQFAGIKYFPGTDQYHISEKKPQLLVRIFKIRSVALKSNLVQVNLHLKLENDGS